MLVRLQIGWPGTQWALLGKLMPDGMESGVMKPEFYISLFTMHGTIMVFFVLSLAPVSGFGNFLIPLQVGARDMAFPFLNMLSFWTVVPGAVSYSALLSGGRWRRGGRMDRIPAIERGGERHPGAPGWGRRCGS